MALGARVTAALAANNRALMHSKMNQIVDQNTVVIVVLEPSIECLHAFLRTCYPIASDFKTLLDYHGL